MTTTKHVNFWGAKLVKETNYLYSTMWYKESIKDEYNILCSFVINANRLDAFLEQFQKYGKSFRLMSITESENDNKSKKHYKIIAYTNVHEVLSEENFTALNFRTVCYWSKFRVNEIAVLNNVVNYQMIMDARSYANIKAKTMDIEFIHSFFNLTRIRINKHFFTFYNQELIKEENKSDLFNDPIPLNVHQQIKEVQKKFNKFIVY